jgi:hypothetical protein
VLAALDDDGTGRLPVGDSYSLSLVLIYGLYQLLRARRQVGTTVDPETGKRSTFSDEQGLIPILIRLLERRGAGAADDLARLLPGEGHLSIALTDIQRSEALEPAPRKEAHLWLAATVDRALKALGLRPPAVHVDDRGDGRRVLAHESAIALTTLARELPPLLAGPLAAHRHDGDPLKVRLALHTDLLHRSELGWEGPGLTEAARFVDAEAVKRMLAASPHRLATIVSTRVHAAMLFSRIPVDDYVPVAITLRGEPTRIWVALS